MRTPKHLILRIEPTKQSVVHLDDDRVWGSLSGDSIDDFSVTPDLKSPSRVVLNCAQAMSTQGVGEDQSDEMSMRLLKSWSQDGWGDFDRSVLDTIKLLDDQGSELVIRPHAQGMLSDAISTVGWANRQIGHEGNNPGVMLDPMGWVTSSMVRDLDDHLMRIEDLCSNSSALMGMVRAIMVRSMRVGDDGSISECALSDGDIDPDRIVGPLKGLIGSVECVVVLDQRDLEHLGLD